MFAVPEIFKHLFDRASGLLCLVDSNSIIRLINKEACEGLGYNHHDLVGLNLLHNSNKKTVISNVIWSNIINCNSNFRVKIFHANGSLKTYIFSSREILLNNEKHFLCQGIDYTEVEEQKRDVVIAEKLYDLNLNRLHKTLVELKRAKAAAEESARSKQLFLANISHEIRTPMNAILGFTNVLINEVDRSEHLQYLNVIKRSGDSLLKIISEILDVSKMESGNFTFDLNDFNLKEVINSVSILFELKLSEKQLDYQVSISSDLPDTLIGDSGRLYQLLVNLIGNAIKFTPHGHIVVKVFKKAETADTIHVGFVVQDSGIGIAPENLAKIFESFTQATNDTTRKFGGTGLGLAICKQLVELQNGKIEVTSQLGEGSTFTFEIPFTKKEVTNADFQSKVLPVEVLEGAGKFKLLLVDDNDINILLVSKIINDWGFQFDTANSGFEAIKKLEADRFDLVLMDVQMPDLDGYQTTELIRNSKHDFRNIPIIATTAHAGADEALRVLKSGMNEYASKPFVFDELLGKITHLLHTSMQVNTPISQVMSNSLSLTNLDYLKSVAAGDQKFINRMIQMYVDKCELSLEEIEQAIQANAWVDFKAHIHRFLPSLSFMGIQNIIEPLHEINEQKNPPSDLSIYRSTILSLREIVMKSKIELLEYLHANKNPN